MRFVSDEFYSMVNFCNPGLLGTTAEFHKHYEKPILDGREPDATEKQLALAQERNAELSELVNKFVLRRIYERAATRREDGRSRRTRCFFRVPNSSIDDCGDGGPASRGMMDESR